MGDHVELQITPETPGRPYIRNPFESPNDYHHLREPLVPSPSVFKSKSCKATPPKFNWSIDEMASLLPVHIDPEEIQRQSFYLSQTRMDSDIEEKRQNAIEQFFTKGAIVPSPWAAPNARKAPQMCKKSSVSPMIAEEPEKITVACQTTLSLPLAFDLEKVLGEYYRYEEPCDAVQESLSSSSLRRKLFLDGQGSYSGSDSSSPPSPERSHVRQEKLSLTRGQEAVCGVEGSEGEARSSVFSSPLSCGVSAPTPSTGQFSSSPIQHGRFRDCSLGSINSPLFPDRSSPAGLVSPTISPIVAHTTRTPTGSAERKQPSNLTPHGVPLVVDVTSCNESPFVEGCSPIRSCSPHQLHCHSEPQHNSRPKPRPRVRCWASPPLISPILNPRVQDHQEVEDQLPSSSSSSSLPSMELDPLSPLVRNNAHSTDTERVSLDVMEPVKMEEDKETGIEGRLEEEEEEEAGGLSGQLTSSRMGNVSGTESSQMFVSLLAEGSSIRYDSSMQVDSGYNTTSAGTVSLIDGLSSDSHSKESFSSNLAEEALQLTRHTKVKVFYPHH
ncbi:protein aurora borealis [Lates calcarifer]|uniref:Protein aurora borealis n=1 Tax=Lates calcarifer TaxID=8187 RepID=A0A4W6DQV8_LATCA|nr:protein aurora borealis [Lates calcarifer]